MRLESLDLRIVLIALLTIALSIAGGGIGLAMISKTGSDAYCNLCHTNGNNLMLEEKTKEKKGGAILKKG